MPEKDLAEIISEVLDSYDPIKTQWEESVTIAKGRRRDNFGGRKVVAPPYPFIVRRRKRRPQRNPLRTSLRLIFVGVVVLCVPLLFSVY